MYAYTVFTFFYVRIFIRASYQNIKRKKRVARSQRISIPCNLKNIELLGRFYGLESTRKS